VRARLDQRLAQSGGVLELLRLPAAVFEGFARLRAQGYERRLLPSARVPVPVVSVGNLSAGGTGKTPCVAYLARRLEARGLRVGVLARGYRAEAGDRARQNDEARWFGATLPTVERVQDPDRVRGAEELMLRGVDVILLDDGFQHRRLARDLDLVLVDATRPWGLPPPRAGAPSVCACLPRGLLREPPSALARADLLIVTRTDQVEPAELAGLCAELERLAPGKPLGLARHSATKLLAPNGVVLPPAALAGRTVELLSALGNPEAFQRSVEALGASVARHHAFPDHHRYSPGELAQLDAGERWLITTEKDAVKLPHGARVHVLATEFVLCRGEATLAAQLEALPRGAARAQRAALHEGLHG
jgi:tetraacyldisaccharide 4'-kinase